MLEPKSPTFFSTTILLLKNNQRTRMSPSEAGYFQQSIGVLLDATHGHRSASTTVPAGMIAAIRSGVNAGRARKASLAGDVAEDHDMSFLPKVVLRAVF